MEAQIEGKKTQKCMTIHKCQFINSLLTRNGFFTSKKELDLCDKHQVGTVSAYSNYKS